MSLVCTCHTMKHRKYSHTFPERNFDMHFPHYLSVLRCCSRNDPVDKVNTT